MYLYPLVLLLAATFIVLCIISWTKEKSQEEQNHDHSHNKKHKHKIGHDHKSGVFSIDYYAYISKIRDWNPGFKVGFSILVLFLCVGFDSISVSMFVLITMGYLTISRGKIPFHEYFNLMTIPLVFIIVGSITIAVNFSFKPIGQYNLNCYWFYIYTSKEQFISMAAIMLKAFAAVSSLYMMSLSTPSGEIISVLRKAKVPKLLVELMSMIYRYIFVIMETHNKMKNSAESRLGYVDYKTALRSFSGTASNLLIVSLKKANSYYDALCARGYTGELLFLEEDKPLKSKHIILGVTYVVFMVLLWATTKFGLLNFGIKF
ncbi:cobalt/nickel transport system permease protein [Acetitomaculum ruminis DSM 5522]|uniref:Cobalt/nickel transport system permease protein n=1 Tax=Acetitomaculum ruminis DSM 5522 TaxID=1120918 RepID=A0A1I0YHZ2_9FIRM|nr:cobalt ECF transporter T component CbiQ [Acetitomaculum ruminis]SFB12497.1 cobalt/nickel transport system permease protein [Acetitomaculum ruminis DSM 5522]